MERALPTHATTHATTALPLLSTRLVWVLTIFSVMASLILGELNVLGSQPPRNPFADYAAMLPGQPSTSAIERGFSCTSIPNYRGMTCADTRSLALLSISEIYILGTQHHIIDRIGFIPRGDSLMIGDLTALWGEPASQMTGSLVVVLCWPGVYALVPLNGQQDVTYFSPVKLVEFHNRADSVCLGQTSLDN